VVQLVVQLVGSEVAPRIAHRRLQSREAKVVSEGADAGGVPAWCMMHECRTVHGMRVCMRGWVSVCPVFAGLVLACTRVWVVDEWVGVEF
jgi:hypothetical protein